MDGDQAIAQALIGSVVDDIYQRAKDMLRARKSSGRSRKNLGLRIYGPKGEVLKEWTTDEDEDRKN